LEGHRLLQRAGLVGPHERFARRVVYDYGHVLHEVQLNAWVLAYRRAAGEARANHFRFALPERAWSSGPLGRSTVVQSSRFLRMITERLGGPRNP
jgi:hypothetical protein